MILCAAACLSTGSSNCTCLASQGRLACPYSRLYRAASHANLLARSEVNPLHAYAGTLEKGSKVARTLAFNRIGIAKAITGFGVDVIMSDADVVWQRDPTDYCTS